MSCNWTFLRSGNYGRVQRFRSSLVGNQEGFWNASSSQVLFSSEAKSLGWLWYWISKFKNYFILLITSPVPKLTLFPVLYREWGAIGFCEIHSEARGHECLPCSTGCDFRQIQISWLFCCKRGKKQSPLSISGRVKNQNTLLTTQFYTNFRS